MNLFVLDIGGTYVKYNFWNEELLETTKKFETPKTYSDLKNEIKTILSNTHYEIDGMAISAPGNFNHDKQIIEGVSAVPYLHQFKIIDDLTKEFKIPVSIENDANCSGLCEVHSGAAKGYKNVACIVLGTGVGGSIFFNGELYRGSNFHSSEFGLTKNSSPNILSTIGTIVKVSDKYERLTGERWNGIELYEMAKANNQLAQDLINEMYDELALFIYNIQVLLDFEVIVIGGGVSEQQEFSEQLSKKSLELFTQETVPHFMPKIVNSQYKNDANLMGAVIVFNDIYKDTFK